MGVSDVSRGGVGGLIVGGNGIRNFDLRFRLCGFEASMGSGSKQAFCWPHAGFLCTEISLSASASV